MSPHPPLSQSLDGGCTIARQAQARAARQEARAEADRGGSSSGYNGPPAIAMTFPEGPFQPPQIIVLGMGLDEDDEDDSS
ncbi:unnamed protein product [Discula destructiva]